MHKIGIIIINFTGYAERFLIECRDGLRSQDFTDGELKVYIVDNASSEESRSYLKNNFPEANIIPRSDGNYCAANNAGVKQAMNNGCDLFVIVNMDVALETNWLTELVKAVDSDPSVGIAQSLMKLYPKEKNQINSTGNILHYLGFGFTANYKLPTTTYNPPVPFPEITGYPSGNSMIIKKEVFEKIGFSDEEYYMYHDDVEFGWRAKLAGYKFVLAPRSIIYHKYEFSRSVLMLYYMERNRYIAIFSFYKLQTIVLLIPAIIATDVAMILFSIASRWFKTKMRVNLYFFKPSSWLHIMKMRREVKNCRILKDKDAIRHFSGKVLFQEIDNPVLRFIGNPLMEIYWRFAKLIIFW